MAEVNQLQERVKNLQTKLLKNENDAVDVQTKANSMTEEVKQAENRASEMQSEYSRTLESLNNRARDSQMEQKRARNLFEKASDLSHNTTEKLEELKGAYVHNSMHMLSFQADLLLVNYSRTLTTRSLMGWVKN